MPLMMLEDGIDSQATRLLRQSLIALGLLPHSSSRSASTGSPNRRLCYTILPNLTQCYIVQNAGQVHCRLCYKLPGWQDSNPWLSNAGNFS
jgi:hypothetical protein